MSRIGAWSWLLAAAAVAVVRPVLGAEEAARQRPEAPAPTAGEPLRTGVDRSFDIQDIRLDLRVDLRKKAVEGQASIKLRSIQLIHSVELDAVGFAVQRVLLAADGGDESPVRFSHDGKRLVAYLEPGWPAGRDGLLRITYRVHEPKDGLHFFGPTAEEPDAPLQVWSQGEAVSNRYWFPCVDAPEQRQTTEIVATVPEGFEVLSNGKLLSRQENASDQSVTFDWRQDKPHPSYLVTMVVGQFDVVRAEWDGIPVLYYVPKGHEKEVAPTFSRTSDMLTYFSKRFGIHYPWDKYAQVVAHHFGGGMENTSATTMGEILIDERTRLDRNSDGIIAHEMAHQWWGDMVTCRDWAHLWLNEGWASYAEALWDEHALGRDAYAYNMFLKAPGAIAGGKNRPVVDRHYPNPMAMFDGRSYPKGAWILHMLRHELGDDAFWKGVQKYAEENRLRSVETADFRRALERVSGRDLERFFYDWTERAGSPEVEVTTEYLAEPRQVKIVVKQTQAAEAFHFPLKVVLHGPGGFRPVVLESRMTEKEAVFTVPMAAPPTRVDVDPDQAVLTEIKETKDRDLWRPQLLEGPDVPARIRAVRHFAEGKAAEDRDLLTAALAKEKFWAIRTELASAVGKSGGGAARDALLQALADPDARVRRACVSALGGMKPDPRIAEAVLAILKNGDASYAVKAAALAAYAKQGRKDAVAVISPWMSKPSYRDTLRGAALSALAEAQDPAALDTLLTWAQPGHPEQSRGAALRGLVKILKKATPTEEQKKKAMAGFAAALKSDAPMLRFGVINGLPDLGPVATDLLPTLDAISKSEQNERVRDLAKRTADRIREKGKEAAPVPKSDLQQLREEVERLKREQDTLKEQLRQLRKAGGRG